jgi:hypothetical protein
VAIAAANPLAGTVDARQPHGPTGDSPRQGIGSASDPIIITLGVSGAEQCFRLCETSPDPTLGANDIATVTDLGGGEYEIMLLHPITPGEQTIIEYLGTGEWVHYISHPANVNGDPSADSSDVTDLIAALNGVPPAYGLFSVDLDHSGALTPADVLRLIDLLNGADSLDAWDGTDRPTNTSCP